MMDRRSDIHVDIRDNGEMRSYAMAVGLYAQRTTSEVSPMTITAEDITLLLRNKSVVAKR